MTERDKAAPKTAPVTIFPGPDELGEALARDILAGMEIARGRARRYLLGCPAGRSLMPTYCALARQAAAGNADLSGLTIVMMDDYLQDAAGGLIACPADAHYSCRRFALAEIRQRLNEALPPDRRITEDSVLLPDPADPEAYDATLEDAGGIDLFLLASGATDGHVAFNAPGSPRDGGTHIARLAAATRRDNLATFPRFGSLNAVPSHGVSIGLGTIVRLSRAVVLVITGGHKRDAAARVLAADDFDAAWPATIVHACRNARILLDAAAAP